MRPSRWLLIGKLGLASCLMAGCLRAALPPEARCSQANISTPLPVKPVDLEKPSRPASDYLVSRTPVLQPSVQQTVATDKPVESPPEKSSVKPVEPVEMRIGLEEPSSPAHPPEPPPHMEVHPAPLTRPDAPLVQVLRGLLEHHSEEEINEQLKPYDTATREAMVLLLTNIVQLEQQGGLGRMSARELATWTDRLNT